MEPKSCSSILLPPFLMGKEITSLPQLPEKDKPDSKLAERQRAIDIARMQLSELSGAIGATNETPDTAEKIREAQAFQGTSEAYLDRYLALLKNPAPDGQKELAIMAQDIAAKHEQLSQNLIGRDFTKVREEMNDVNNSLTRNILPPVQPSQMVMNNVNKIFQSELYQKIVKTAREKGISEDMIKTASNMLIGAVMNYIANLAESGANIQEILKISTDLRWKANYDKLSPEDRQEIDSDNAKSSDGKGKHYKEWEKQYAAWAKEKKGILSRAADKSAAVIRDCPTIEDVLRPLPKVDVKPAAPEVPVKTMDVPADGTAKEVITSLNDDGTNKQILSISFQSGKIILQRKGDAAKFDVEISKSDAKPLTGEAKALQIIEKNTAKQSENVSLIVKYADSSQRELNTSILNTLIADPTAQKVSGDAIIKLKKIA